MSFGGSRMSSRKSLAIRDPATQEKVDLLNRLNIDTVILMREINQDLVDINNIIRKSLMPVIEKYGENCESIRDSVEIWKHFFEASANVDLEGFVDDESQRILADSNTHVFDVGRKSLGASTPNRIDTSPLKAETTLSPVKRATGLDITTGDLFNLSKEMHRVSPNKAFRVQITHDRSLRQINDTNTPARALKKSKIHDDDAGDNDFDDSPSLHPPVLESEMQYSPIRKKPGIYNKFSDPLTLPNLKFGNGNPDNSDSYSTSLTQQPVLSEYGRLQTLQNITDGHSQSIDPIAPTLTAISMNALSAVPEETSELAPPKLAFEDEENPFKE
ncbi:unnamed protein product [Kuraishia capsulata CBS 1993]|uniref:DASH complex subunit ASK1 n=1 Tax=Kuraishia capsulata CBS 1993 TaxID=1382522 RepID=W6MFR5_9ASCO|nr:uncharacterized protein KUCA_T00000434001 [Kuraishia capsulata CBS 1993]CDK24471.1 unnamed protein product [Kuraishia capsulata CBS 1993]